MERKSDLAKSRITILDYTGTLADRFSDSINDVKLKNITLHETNTSYTNCVELMKGKMVSKTVNGQYILNEKDARSLDKMIGLACIAIHKSEINNERLRKRNAILERMCSDYDELLLKIRVETSKNYDEIHEYLIQLQEDILKQNLEISKLKNTVVGNEKRESNLINQNDKLRSQVRHRKRLKKIATAEVSERIQNNSKMQYVYEKISGENIRFKMLTNEYLRVKKKVPFIDGGHLFKTLWWNFVQYTGKLIKMNWMLRKEREKCQKIEKHRRNLIDIHTIDICDKNQEIAMVRNECFVQINRVRTAESEIIGLKRSIYTLENELMAKDQILKDIGSSGKFVQYT